MGDRVVRGRWADGQVGRWGEHPLRIVLLSEAKNPGSSLAKQLRGSFVVRRQTDSSG